MLTIYNKWVKNNKILDKDKLNKQNVIKINPNKSKQQHKNKKHSHNHKKLLQRREIQHKS